ncbi:hypothetical protein [Streptomyces sp. NPDC051561]|uniref:hypothetical protein n=1 Tax=Streptomyces sp. NPDC051561 TaxID=3365658 RepID=UPI0037B7E8A5
MTDREPQEPREQPRARAGQQQDPQRKRAPQQQEQQRKRAPQPAKQPRVEHQQPYGRPESGQEQEQEAAGPVVGEYAPPYVRHSSQVAAVMLYKNGGYSILWPDHREDVRKPWVGSPYSIVEVRLGTYVTSFALRLPAAGDAAFFDATARVHWRVVDPRAVVAQNVRDVGELLRDDLLAGLRNVSRRFRLTESHRADDAFRAEVEAGRIDLGRDLGLSTRVHVFIDLSEEVKKHVQEKDIVDIDMANEVRRDEAVRRRAERKRRAVQEEAAALQQVLSRGEESEIAYYMATNPDIQWEIRKRIQEEKRAGQQDFIGLFHKLLDTGNLERHDIGDHMYEVIQYLREQSGGVVGGVGDSMLTAGRGGGRGVREALEGNRNGRSGRDGDHGRELERGGGGGGGVRRERGEPVDPYWGEETEGVGEPGGRVYEGTVVESWADRERERGRERGRERDWEREREWEREPGREWDRGRDRDRDAVQGQEPDREPDDWRDPDDFGPNHRSAQGGWTHDGQPRRTSGQRTSRPSADFDDWDDE